MKNYFLVFMVLFCWQVQSQSIYDEEEALIRSDTTESAIYLCFTAHDYDDGLEHVLQVLQKHEVQGSFFLTGDFVRNHPEWVKKIAKGKHLIGAHSDRHLLYCDWVKRDSLLVSEKEIKRDIQNNLCELRKLGVQPTVFMPPYEWYNKKVVRIASQLDQTTVNFTPGTRSNADYTTPDMDHYISSETILQSIYNYEKTYGMNGFHLLIHPGVSPKREDKFYLHLDELINYLQEAGYKFSHF